MENVTEETKEISEETEKLEETIEETTEEKTEEILTEETKEEVSEEKPKPGDIEYTKKVQERIDQITREKYQEKKRADQLEVRLKNLEQVSQKDRPARPVLKYYINEYGDVDYDRYNKDIAKYEDTLLDWRDERRQSKEREDKAKEEEAIKVDSFRSLAEPLREKYSDFDETVDKPIFSPDLRKVLFKRPDIAYYLGKNEQEAKRLSTMELEGRTLEMMEEIVKLKTKVPELLKSTSKAPPPISPVEGEKGAMPVDESKLSDKEWFKREEKKRFEKVKEQYG